MMRRISGSSRMKSLQRLSILKLRLGIPIIQQESNEIIFNWAILVLINQNFLKYQIKLNWRTLINNLKRIRYDAIQKFKKTSLFKIFVIVLNLNLVKYIKEIIKIRLSQITFRCLQKVRAISILRKIQSSLIRRGLVKSKIKK